MDGPCVAAWIMETCIEILRIVQVGHQELPWTFEAAIPTPTSDESDLSRNVKCAASSDVVS